MIEYNVNNTRSELIQMLTPYLTSDNKLKKNINYFSGNTGRIPVFVNRTKTENIFTLIHPANQNRQWTLVLEDNLISINTNPTAGSMLGALFPIVTIFVIGYFVLQFSIEGFIQALCAAGLLVVSHKLSSITNKKAHRLVDRFIQTVFPDAVEINTEKQIESDVAEL